MRKADHHIKNWIEHTNRQKIIGGLSVFEDVLYIVLAVLFALSSMIVIGQFLWSSMKLTSYSSFIQSSLDHFLIVFMLIELMHTTLLYLRTHRFRHEPFLMVGIIAGIRSLLILSANYTIEIHSGELIYILKLGVSAVVILTLAIALKISRTSVRRNQDEPPASRD